MIVQRVRSAINRRRYKFLHQRIRNIQIPGGAVSITFDDFPVTAATTAADALEAHEMRGTFYLAPGLISKKGEAVGEIASLEDVADLIARGHEIGAHTFSHFACQGASARQLGKEYAKSSELLDRISGNRHFAFPFGAYDDASLIYFSKRYATLRTVTHGLNVGETDINLLKANPVYSDIDFGKIEKQLDDARKRHGWLILYTHDVTETPSEFGTTPQDFERLLTLIRDAGVRVDTVSGISAHIA